MKNIINTMSILATLILLTPSAKANKTYPEWFQPGEKIVRLYNYDPKIKVTFETKQALITLDYDICIKYLQNKIARMPNSKTDKRLLVKLIQEAATSKEISLGKYVHDRHRNTYLVADLIQSGNAKILDKTTQQSLKSVKMEMHAKNLYGGRNFFLPNGTVFLTVFDRLK